MSDALIAVLAFAACLLGIRAAARAGLARLYVSQSNAAGASLPLADAAVRLEPADPETHAARARALKDAGRLDEVVGEYERAVALRPSDFSLWLQLGHARDKVGDREGALAAFDEAVRLAPYYAAPHWYRGYALLRLKRYGDGFDELRRAAESDPARLGDLFDLAWEIYGGDATAVWGITRPQTDKERVALALYLARRGSTAEATQVFDSARVVSDQDRSELVRVLLDGKQFRAAYEVWSGAGGQGQNVPTAAVVNGGFEGRMAAGETGFGWRVARDPQGARVSVDSGEAREGARSLQVEFTGASEPSAKFVSQLVVVEPRTRYRLTFAARTKELTTGGPPFIGVTEGGGKDGRLLARSVPLLQGSWQNYSVDFTTPEGVGAVSIVLLRENCATQPCPAFGHLWLDDFSLRRY